MKSSTPKEPATSSTKQKPKSQTAKPRPVERASKLSIVIGLLSRKQGATIAEIMKATGWQAHSVRGAMSGAVKKKSSHAVTSSVQGDSRRYRLNTRARG